MPPLSFDLAPPPIPNDEVDLDDLSLAALEHEGDHDGHSHLEERKFEFNIKGNWNDLMNLDYSKVVWRNVILFIVLHLYAVYGIHCLIFHATWKLKLFTFYLYFASGMGITMGVHRLWAHKSFKANLPVKIFLAACNSLAFQNSIFEWSRDHRVHHKFSETDADPHNANRGFFFSHMGWLMLRKHPDVIRKGKTIDMSDLEADPVVMFQKKHYIASITIFCFFLPSWGPWYLWGENFTTALFVCGFARYCVGLHITWMVNSLAHWLGSKPYEKTISPSENAFVATLALGEGWHNYHHVFPYDYRTAELGKYFNINATKNLIDFCAYMGWVWDRKVANPEVLKMRVLRTGDGSHKPRVALSDSKKVN